jgi:hypothetical protein
MNNFSKRRSANRARFVKHLGGRLTYLLRTLAELINRRSCKNRCGHMMRHLTRAPLLIANYNSVIEKGRVYPLVFSCRRRANDWLHAKTGQIVSIRPTHWRFWPEE